MIAFAIVGWLGILSMLVFFGWILYLIGREYRD